MFFYFDSVGVCFIMCLLHWALGVALKKQRLGYPGKPDPKAPSSPHTDSVGSRNLRHFWKKLFYKTVTSIF